MHLTTGEQRLRKVLEYPAPGLIAQAMGEMVLSETQVRDRLFELRHYFCLLPEYGRLPAPVRIDNLWHVFLDREDEYRRFCLECFDGIIEHIPHANPPAKGVAPTLDAVHAKFGNVGARMAAQWQGETRCDGLWKAAP